MNGANGSCVVGGGGVIVEARDLVLSFGETPALRGASISVKRGEIVAVMGPSGSGKSTLLHCLAGILVPDSGEVTFDGQRLDTMRAGRPARSNGHGPPSSRCFPSREHRSQSMRSIRRPRACGMPPCRCG